MSEIERYEQIPIQPLYEQQAPNEAIEIGEFKVKCRFGGKDYPGTAIARMEFATSPRLRFHAKIDVELENCLKGLMFKPSDTNRITFLEKNATFNCGVIRDPSGVLVFDPFTSMVSLVGDSRSLDHVVIHLMNFPKFNELSNKNSFVLHTRGPTGQRARACGRTFLEALGWQVTIAEIETTDSVAKTLKLQGGYVITHVARVARSNGGQFCTDEFSEVFNQLQRFLSFALGRWAGLSFPVGFDANHNVVYEGWGTLRVSRDHWHASNSWFDCKRAELLSQVWPGFYALSQRSEWQEKLQIVIAWYVAANEQGTSASNDIRICMAESALELIVALEKIPKGRRKISEQIELLASDSNLDLPLEIPTNLVALSEYNSIAEAIVRLRNEVVHAKSKETIRDGTWLQGWRLSMWYLDLIILKLCNHNGEYANRLAKRFIGNLEAVPWGEES